MPVNVIRQEKEYIIKQQELQKLLGIDEKEQFLNFQIDRAPDGVTIRIITTTASSTNNKQLGGYNK